MVEIDNFKSFNLFKDTFNKNPQNYLYYSFTDNYKHYQDLIDKIKSEMNWNKMQKNIDFNEYLNALKEELIIIKKKRESFLPIIQIWEKKYSFTYPDFPLVETKVKNDPTDEFDIDEFKTVFSLNNNVKPSLEEQQDIDKMQHDFSEYIKEDAINKVLKIIEEEEFKLLPQQINFKKIKTNLNVYELAYLFRLLTEVKIINDDNIMALCESIVNTFETKMQKNNILDKVGFYNKFYTKDPNAIESLHSYFTKMRDIAYEDQNNSRA
jgi:hypothetical protein